ncbi:nose resistant to fluoxetine protein 6-like isoform X2 [Frankliniella occidentalis]|uniref:Nose resistant to fluoxetine protein 6-like isoform X2 n=1 Tax=Frankliniella occidentalis TaxID=133901 RepID=A0A9C6WZ57_FRAOC|nr:nose resistant to fluoxetine protein 6-like isoform X2 [Frankliniella occidentalis]
MCKSDAAGTVLTLLLLTVGCYAGVAVNATDEAGASHDAASAATNAAVNVAVDALLDSALQRALATLKHPASLREHVGEALRLEKRPEVLASAADCDLALARWAEGLYYTETWALQMVDSSSKFVTGLLYGNLADLGNYDECVTSEPISHNATAVGQGAPEEFTGRYALPALQLLKAVNSSSKLSASLQQTLARTASSHQDSNGEEYSALGSVNLAVCVPSTCQAPLLETVFNHVLNLANPLLEKKGYRVQVSLPANYTSVAGLWREPDTGDYTVITICVVLLLLVLVATSMDVTLSSEAVEARKRAGVLLAFSAYTNGRRLMHVAPPSDSNFTCINGIRFFSAMWVILGHRYRWALDIPYTNLIVIPQRVTDISVMMIASAPLSVDTFFLIGGLVNSYSFMRAVGQRKSFNFIMYYVHRYIRLTPAFAMMVAITATWLALLGNGPLWTKVMGSASQSCRDNWWTAMLYVANYANANDQCMMQSWYLMVDMQLHWLSPLLLVPLWKWRRIGLGWIGIVLIASCAVPFAITFANPPHFRAPISVELSKASQSFFMAHMYFPTHTRFTSYVFGTLAGYVLFIIKAGHVRYTLSSKEVALGWLMSTAICLTVVFGAQPLFDAKNHPFNVWESSFYLGFYKLAWSVGITWVVLACILGRGGPVNAFLSWTPFTIMGRLTYGIYLAHAAIQIVDVSSNRSAEYYTDFKMVEHMLSDATLASFFGLVLCLTLESPIMAIEKALRTGGSKRSKPRKQEKDVPTNGGVDNSGFIGDADSGRTHGDGKASSSNPIAHVSVEASTTGATSTDDNESENGKSVVGPLGTALAV